MSKQISNDRIERLSPAKRALFEQLRRADSAAQRPLAITPRAVGSAAPLSFAQHQLWFLDQLDPGNPAYNVATAARLTGSLDAAALEAALQAVVDRHESLRTTFRLVDGRAEQAIAPASAVQITLVHAQNWPAVDREAKLRQLAATEALAPFHLSNGPLLRATLVHLSKVEHVLLLTMHHIVCDGWSMAVLRDEVAENYAAIVGSRAPRIAPLPIQYADFAAWQREQLRGPVVERLLNYWSRQLAGAPEVIELPLDHPRPATQGYRGDVRRLPLAGTLVAELRRLANEEGATLFMTLMAAFQILLARYSRQKDVCVGTPIAGRSRTELEGLIGFFVNTLVIRGRLEENPTFRELLAQLRETTLAAYAHQDLPFERLVEYLRPARDTSRTPLVQAMFVLQNIPLRPREVAGLSISDIRFDHAPISNFDLTLNVDEHPDRLDLSLVYNVDLFEPATIERMLASYELLLRGIIESRDARVQALPLVDPVAARRQLAEWNDTSAPYSHDLCVHEMISAQARRTPAATALETDQHGISYAELDRRSNRLARYLIDQGVGPDVAVGLCLDRSPELIISMLAILKAGGAYVPLDPAYPAARRQYMIDDAQLALVVTSSEIAPQLTPGDFTRVLIDAEAPAIAACDDSPLPRRANPQNLANVIYTSGSTGQPKGVEVEHRGLVNHAEEFVRQYEMVPGDRLLFYLSLSFDAAAEEIFPALASGATLFVHPQPAELSGRELLDWTRAYRVNLLHAPPAICASLVDEMETSGRASAAHLKCVITGGDNVPRDLVRRFRKATGAAVKFVLAYGVTESTITTTVCNGSAQLAPSASRRLPIGRPIANSRAYVLDECSQPAPVGVPGELVVGGVGVARGYRGRPDATAAKFGRDPFDARPDARIYRTGDLARFLPDGNLEFLGRLDLQVKIRGYRIEPGEIEAALNEHEHVIESIVVPHPDGATKRLAAYVGCGPGPLPSEVELRAFLAGRLPAHMSPASLTILEHLPRLPGAKVDVKALPAPCWQRGDQHTAYTPPRNDVESRLAEIWQDVLGVDRVGIHDNFFDLGGDSIRSIQVVARAGATGLRFTPKQLFQNQSIAELAPLVGAAPAAYAEQGPIVGPVPLMPIQRRFFELDLTDPHHFNQSLLFEVRNPATFEMLAQATATLLVHHDVLRMRYYHAADGQWQQECLPPADGSGDGAQNMLERVDLTETTDAELAAEIERHASIAQASLDLESGRLTKFAYFDLGPSRSARLLAVVHHLVVDAVSWRILFGDLNLLCGQIARGDAPQLPPKTTALRDWALRLIEYAASDDVRSELDVWTAERLRPRPLPCDLPGKSNTVADQDSVHVELSTEATQRLLGETSNDFRARPQELLIAALAQVVTRYSGGEAVAFDLEGHGREDLFTDVDLSRTVGWFTSAYPITLERPQLNQPVDWVRAIKEQLRAVRNSGIGNTALRWLSSDASVRKRLADATPPEIAFNYLGQFDHLSPPDALLNLAHETCGPECSPRGARAHLWEVNALVLEGRFQVRWIFSKSHHTRATIERLANEYLAELERMNDQSQAPGVAVATPTDFPLADIDQQDLDQLAALLEQED